MSEKFIHDTGCSYIGGLSSPNNPNGICTKKQRAHWFFDEYLYACGKAIANYAHNKEEYYATYMRYLTYADAEIKIHMNKLDSLLKKGDTAAKIKEVNALVAIYNEKYKTEQYQLHKRKNKKWVRF